MHLYLSIFTFTVTIANENFSFYIFGSVIFLLWAYMKSDTLRCLRAPVWKYKIYIELSKFASDVLT